MGITADPDASRENSGSIPANELDEDWEEWDGRSPFWAHCLAGSIAGVVEHAAIFPLDTVRTHIQVCAACLQSNIKNTTSSSSNGMFTPPS